MMPTLDICSGLSLSQLFMYAYFSFFSPMTQYHILKRIHCRQTTGSLKLVILYKGSFEIYIYLEDLPCGRIDDSTKTRRRAARCGCFGPQTRSCNTLGVTPGNPADTLALAEEDSRRSRD